MRDSSWPQLSKVSVKHFLDRYVNPKPDSTFYKLYLNQLHLAYNKGDGINNQGTNNNWTYTYETVFEYLKKYAMAANFTHPPDVESVTRNKTMIPMLNPAHLGLESLEQAEIDWIRGSFYRLNVYFAEPVVEVQRQVLHYSEADLGSGIGGILGLWAGLSIVSIIEFIEYSITVCKLVKFRRKSPKKKEKYHNENGVSEAQ